MRWCYHCSQMQVTSPVLRGDRSAPVSPQHREYKCQVGALSFGRDSIAGRHESSTPNSCILPPKAVNNPLSTALIPLTVTLSLSLMLQKGKSQMSERFIALKPILACLCSETVFRDLMRLNVQEGPSTNPKSLKYFSSPQLCLCQPITSVSFSCSFSSPLFSPLPKVCDLLQASTLFFYMKSLRFFHPSYKEEKAGFLLQFKFKV